MLKLVDKSCVIVVQAPESGNGKRFEVASSCHLEGLPMIVPKNYAEGMEFLLTVVLSAFAGLMAFLLVSLIAYILGLNGC